MAQFSRSTLFDAGALVMTAASRSSLADEYVTNLGPVGPNELILPPRRAARDRLLRS